MPATTVWSSRTALMAEFGRRLSCSRKSYHVKSAASGSGPIFLKKSRFGTSVVGIKRIQPNFRWSLKKSFDPSSNVIVTCVDLSGSSPIKLLFGELPDKSTHVTITFEDGSKLFFNDQRKFGWMRLIPTTEVPNLDFFKKIGPEPLAADFTWYDFREQLKRRPNSAIKAVLLDQTVVAGIGNIYADESLWGAKIHPATPVKSLSDAKIKRLYESLVAALELSIEKGGSTDRNYVNAEGKRGSYLSFAK